eukprot:1212411-Pyramimonas_sp.AAC.1
MGAAQSRRPPSGTAAPRPGRWASRLAASRRATSAGGQRLAAGPGLVLLGAPTPSRAPARAGANPQPTAARNRRSCS